MSVRQYIGARYVIKVYENTLDPSSAEWQASVNYEPLTLVTYNYGSYLSKKTVPASVGNPSDNPTYWAQTGFYNGQISNLQNQIDDINAALSIINNKNAVFIGDSYSTISTGYTKAIPETLKDIMHFDNIYNYAVGGAGYKNGDGTNQHFLGQINAASAAMTSDEKNSITHVFIIGGQNDYSYSVSDLVPLYNSTMSAAKATFPNADVYVYPVFYNKGLPTSAYNSIFTIIYHVAKINGCRTDLNSWSWLIDPNVTMMDSVHPNQNGITMLSTCIASAVSGGDTSLNYALLNSAFTVPAGVSIVKQNSSINAGIVNLEICLSLSSSFNANDTLITMLSDCFRPQSDLRPVIQNLSTTGFILGRLDTSGKLITTTSAPAGIYCISFSYSLFGSY